MHHNTLNQPNPAHAIARAYVALCSASGPLTRPRLVGFIAAHHMARGVSPGLARQYAHAVARAYGL